MLHTRIAVSGEYVIPRLHGSVNSYILCQGQGLDSVPYA